VTWGGRGRWHLAIACNCDSNASDFVRVLDRRVRTAAVSIPLLPPPLLPMSIDMAQPSSASVNHPPRAFRPCFHSASSSKHTEATLQLHALNKNFKRSESNLRIKHAVNNNHILPQRIPNQHASTIISTWTDDRTPRAEGVRGTMRSRRQKERGASYWNTAPWPAKS
jgi:hypothetical protein